MWSDRRPPAQLRGLIATLHSILPAPRPGASSEITAVPGDATCAQVAELLHTEPGFASVNFTTASGDTGSYFLHRPLLAISYSAGQAVIEGPQGLVTIPGLGFDILQAALQAWEGPSAALLAGYLSYDLAAEIEDLGPAPPAKFAFPDFHFGLFDSALTFSDGQWSITETDAWRTHRAAAEDILARAAGVQSRPADAVDRLSFGALTSRPSRSAFEASVERIVRAIYAGDIFQTNLCRCIETHLPPGAEWGLHQRMRSINPSRYEAFLRIGDERSILSISPELFLKVDAGRVESSPIKGTRPRGHSDGEDRALSAELLASEKDRAELAMIVDVVRNDLARVCRTGSVEVACHADLMTLPTVHHLFSTIKGRLREGAGPVELLLAAFPAASISGAPKIEAVRAAMREEGQPRGPCMGAIGWISLDGNMELSVAIRTAFVTGGVVRYYAGCGITAGSVPEMEFVESRHKAAAFVRALGMESDSGW